MSNKEFPNGRIYTLDENSPFLLNFNGDVLEICSQKGIDFRIAWARIGNNNIKLMQFTGLKDKNGKEIYEGDLGRLYCHDDCGGAMGEIKWWNDGWWIMTNRNHLGIDGEYKLRTSEVVQSIDQTGEWSQFEVIGNIHENPKLLEEVK